MIELKFWWMNDNSPCKVARHKPPSQLFLYENEFATVAIPFSQQGTHKSTFISVFFLNRSYIYAQTRDWKKHIIRHSPYIYIYSLLHFCRFPPYTQLGTMGKPLLQQEFPVVWNNQQHIQIWNHYIAESVQRPHEVLAPFLETQYRVLNIATFICGYKFKWILVIQSLDTKKV